jgi:outer membrane protein assembly factor BamB
LAISTLGVGLWNDALAQLRRPGEWPTHSGDPQRTAWQKNETRISAKTVSGFQLLWKLKLDNQTRALHSLTVPLIVGGMYKDLAVIGGTSDTIYLLDADLGRLLWKKHFDYNGDTPPDQNATWLCPGGLVATPVITPLATFGRGGRGAAAAVTANTPVAPPATAGRGGGGARGPRSIYAVSSDGNLHQLSLNDGEETAPPTKFVPPNGKPYSLNLVDNVIYATTAQRCGGNPNGVYSIDLSSSDKKVSFFASQGGIWGLAGPAIGTDGTVYVETGDGPNDPANGQFSVSILALTPKELKLKDYYTPSNAEWLDKRDLDLNSTPVVFPYKGRDLIAGATGKEGRLFLLDSRAIGGEDHRKPLYRSDLIANYDVSFDARGIWGSLASWEDANGTRWVLAPIWGSLHPTYKFPITNGEAPHGSIGAFKLEEQNGKPVLMPAWVSRDLIAPAPPVVANGVVFALSSGEFVQQPYPAEERARRSTHATLYALDAETGKELYSSGEGITSFTHFGAMSLSSGRVFLTTHDNMAYAFGIYMEQ